MAGCQPERTPDEALDFILASPSFIVWVDNAHMSWSVRVEPAEDGRVVNAWSGYSHSTRRPREQEPAGAFDPVPYTTEHDALIRQIVAEAGIDSTAREFGSIRWGLEGRGERLVLDRTSSRSDSLILRLINLGH